MNKEILKPLIFDKEVEESLDSKKDMIKSFIDSGEMKSYTIGTNKNGSILTIRVKL